MARSSILDRFRPVGAPGSAGPAGVPSVDERGPAVELIPVFAALALDVESSRMVVEEATSDAAAIVARAREQASALVAQAQLDARAARAGEAAQVERSAGDQDRSLLASARTQADDLARTGSAQLPALVSSVIERLVIERLVTERLVTERLAP
ncbi:MAG TPA: hypothetical protein PKN27_02925 [Propionibacteriaceae bacterium]|nr:hypothetical protein [Propionibacteriaceae bacterium]